MKLALVGGGGVRAPLFVGAAIKRAPAIGLTEICLFDIDASRLAIFGSLCEALASRSASPVRITTADRPEPALEGAAFAVTAIRPGGEEGRIADEKIALSHGVIGQETTGAGGFAMALRSIPVILGYASLLARLSPKAWLLNFTNPAGLVTQALHDAGFERAIGICDSANAAQSAVARWAGVPEGAVEAEVFGLNHLSFTRATVVNGENMLPRALADDGFLASTAQRVFAPHIVRRHGMWINEYLYYYYYAERALAEIAAGPTRGEEIRALNQALVERLGRIDIAREPDTALDAYFAYEKLRSSTYMGFSANGNGADRSVDEPDDHDDDGYAGVALDVIEAMTAGKPLRTGLNVANRGAITDLDERDVVEVSCLVDVGGARPTAIGPMPESQAYLVQSVKHYERVAVRAIRERRRDLAVEALVAHPLVLSYSRAEPLVDEYLSAHAAHVGEWR